MDSRQAHSGLSDDRPANSSKSCVNHPLCLQQAKEVLLARLRNLLDQSGEPVPSADLETWLDGWMYSPLAELGGLTPAEIITSSRGLHELETLLERMRGGLAA
ncbi:MbcA/ParS/Xre antitoxin family protein [Roseateles toxinivorans]|uniref:MbcA/ParS/Xre antitoxin family protein n=1 Tax=Roseateles toxinivorans TaxID=270368 RepID=UPI003C7CB394